MNSRIAISTLLVTWTSVVLGAPDAPPDWSADQFLIGNWTCDQSRPSHPIAHEEAAYTIGLGGHWLELTYTLLSVEHDVPAQTTTAFETFDRSLEKWVYISMGSDGHYGTSYSDGWKGNIKTYGPAASSPQTWRLITTKLGKDEFTEVIEAATGNDEWQRTVSLHCRRAH